MQISCQVRNAGNRSGSEVVQLYIQDPLASVCRPRMELKGFARIPLEPGETKSVAFSLPIELLAYYDADMNLVVEPGEFKVMLGSSSEDIRLEGVFKLLVKRDVTSRKEFRTAVTVA